MTDTTTFQLPAGSDVVTTYYFGAKGPVVDDIVTGRKGKIRLDTATVTEYADGEAEVRLDGYLVKKDGTRDARYTYRHLILNNELRDAVLAAHKAAK